MGQTAVTIPGSRSFVDLGFDAPGVVSLSNFDTTANNAGFSGISAEFATTVNTIAGTQPDGSQTGAINPGIDDRQGTVTATGIPGVSRIDGLGYELWQDSTSENSSGADTLGSMQYLGSMGGYLIERDGFGDFPTLAGQGLGSTMWPLVDSSQVGNTFNTASGPVPTATITDGITDDIYSVAGNGGLALTDYAGDLGAYLDAVVIPNIAAYADSFVYLEAGGFGISNSFDPVFQDSNAYDVVLVAQLVPEPSSVALLALGGLLGLRRRRRS